MLVRQAPLNDAVQLVRVSIFIHASIKGSYLAGNGNAITIVVPDNTAISRGFMTDILGAAMQPAQDTRGTQQVVVLPLLLAQD